MRKDFVATGFVVNNGKVLLIRHKKLGLWLPIGGHIEEHETPEEALRREAREEACLEIEILAKPGFVCPAEGVSMLSLPHHMQLELIKDPVHGLHQHIDLIFFCRAKKGDVRLNQEEHDDIRWFSDSGLDSPEVSKNVRILGKKALEIAEPQK